MRVLIVGAGFMGMLHARVVCETYKTRLCGVVDSSPIVATEAGRKLGVPSFTDVADALDMAQPDVAIVATSDSAHREPAEILIEAGIAVLVEKPLATTVEDAEAIVWLAEKRNVRLMTGHTTRFLPRYTRVADTVRDRDLGKPVLVTTSTWGLESTGARVSKTTDPLWHFAIHDIDVIQWIGGAVIEEVDGAQLVESASGVSTFAATGALKNDVAFSMATGWTLPDTAPPSWDLKVHCQRGTVQATWGDDGVTRYSYDDVRQPDCTLWPSMYGRIEGALRMEMDHFLHAVGHGTPFLITPEEALNAVRGAAVLEGSAIIRKVA